MSWPLAARAQQSAAGDRIHSQSPDTYADRLRAFHRGLKDTDYVESENVTILYRWAESQLDRLPELGGRSGPPTDCRHRRRKYPFGVGGQGGYHDDPHSIHRRRPTYCGAAAGGRIEDVSTGPVAARATGLMCANMLRAFQVG
jgi:hypothetical protein